jgi:hypothetical protein
MIITRFIRADMIITGDIWGGFLVCLFVQGFDVIGVLLVGGR